MPIVSVIGNFDKGKSFILSELSKKQFPSGFDAITPWITGFYPPNEKIKKDAIEGEELEFLNALLLDTAGFETPAQYNTDNLKVLIITLILYLILFYN